MKILICGARGFLGRALADHLRGAGHEIVEGVRRPQGPAQVAIDYQQDVAPALWRDRLAGIDTVINAVGILTETGTQRFETIHHRAPAALFAACAQAGVQRVIQVSALGADRGQSAYFRSKRAADEALIALPLPWVVVRPALVYGPGGHSAGFFAQLASLPLTPLPGGGHQMLQPIHVGDLCACVARLLEAPPRQVVELAGPALLSWRAMLASYRRQLDLPPAAALSIPGALMGATAQIAGHLPGAMLTPDTWRMLSQGNTSAANAAPALLGRPPRPVDAFIPPAEAPARRAEALRAWQRPLLRYALALVWLWTAVVSLGIHPWADSLALLHRVGLDGAPALAALIGASAIDALLGLATLFTPGRRLWWAQIGLIAGYSLIIVVALPEFLTHPFGPLIKNLPILALLTFLLAEETRP